MLTDILRRGNIVGVYSNQSGMGIIEVVEARSIQVENNPVPDDIRDVFGLPITDIWLKRFSFVKNRVDNTWTNNKFPAIYIKRLQGKWLLAIENANIAIEYIHELQNLFVDLAHERLTAGNETDF